MKVQNIPSEAKGGYVLMTTTHGEKYISTEVLKKFKKDKKKKDAKI
jgi:hypothetical protein